MAEPAANETVVDTTHENGVFKFFSNPWVGIIGSIASILGVPLAFYFYAQTVSGPDVVCYPNPVRTVVVKQGTASRLTVSFDGHPVAQDITAAQIAIWNRGRQAVRREDSLRPVVIRTEPRVPILEATIKKQSREVAGLALDQAHAAAGEVTFSWNILEQSDGGVLQLIYAASPETEIRCDGVIVGQAAIRELKPTLAIRSPADQLKEERRSNYGMVFAVVVMLLSFAFWFREFRRRRRNLPLKVYLPLLAFAFVSLTLAGYATYVFMRSVPVPPFGFQ